MMFSLVMPSASVLASSNKIEKGTLNRGNSTPFSAELIEKIDRYVELDNNGQFKIKSENKLLEFITPSELALVEGLIKSANKTNSDMKNDKENSGTITMTDNKVSLSISDTEIFDNKSEDPLFTPASNRISGVTKVDFYWWGMRVYLSKLVVNAASAASIGAAGFIASKLSVAYPVGLAIAAALGAAGYLGTQIPYGVEMRVNYIPGLGSGYTITQLRFQTRGGGGSR